VNVTPIFLGEFIPYRPLLIKHFPYISSFIVKLSPLEKRIINKTRPFRRLFYISQLSFLPYSPYLRKLLAKTTGFLSQSVESLEGYNRGWHSILVRQFSYIRGSILNKRGLLGREEVEELKVASLLHDVGHGPFSHVFESPVKELTGLDHEKVGRDIILEEYPTLLRSYGFDEEKIANIATEHTSSLQTILLHGKDCITIKVAGIDIPIFVPFGSDMVAYLHEDPYLTATLTPWYYREQDVASCINFSDENVIIPVTRSFDIYDLTNSYALLQSQVYNDPFAVVLNRQFQSAVYDYLLNSPNPEAEARRLFKQTDSQVLNELRKYKRVKFILEGVNYRIIKLIYAEEARETRESETQYVSELTGIRDLEQLLPKSLYIPARKLRTLRKKILKCSIAKEIEEEFKGILIAASPFPSRSATKNTSLYIRIEIESSDISFTEFYKSSLEHLGRYVFLPNEYVLIAANPYSDWNEKSAEEILESII